MLNYLLSPSSVWGKYSGIWLVLLSVFCVAGTTWALDYLAAKRKDLQELRQLSTPIEFDQANSELRKASREKAWPLSPTPT